MVDRRRWGVSRSRGRIVTPAPGVQLPAAPPKKRHARQRIAGRASQEQDCHSTASRSPVGERNNTQTAPRNNKTAQLTVADLAEAKRLPVEFLSGEVGLRDLPGGVGIPYHNAAGEE